MLNHWQEHKAQLLGFIRKKVGDSATAEDILQDVYIKAHIQAHTLKDESSLGAWLPVLHRAHIIHENTGYDFLAFYPKTKAWQKSLLATGLAEKTVSDDFVEAFTSFYLSNETLLGRCEQGGECNAFNLEECCIEADCCEAEHEQSNIDHSCCAPAAKE
ncbi:sigma factor [Endozoicomonas numazuensis]|uniref:sigma factor n=1 Tax=Endozoicomonas numazuensis TaxID=1137799 RepID=UPI0006906154|nr:sigma factor [Endozoicomonas numazuensis]